MTVQKMEQAVPYLEASLADNETVQAHMLLAEHHIFKGHKDLAEKHYKRAYEMASITPDDIDVFCGVTVMCLLLKMFRSTGRPG